MKAVYMTWAVCFLILGCGGSEEEVQKNSYSLDSLRSCNEERLNICFDNGGGTACYEKWSCQPYCNLKQMEVCIKNGGGSACKAKWSCLDGLRGDRMAEFYRNNYSRIQKEVATFHTGSYGCAAYASTALKLYGFPIKQVKVTNQLENQLKEKGWKKITDLTKLQKGDVVFTSKSTSNIPGTWSHVYVFQGYLSGRRYAYVTDNYGKYGQRNIYAGSRSPSVIAYRY